MGNFRLSLGSLGKKGKDDGAAATEMAQVQSPPPLSPSAGPSHQRPYSSVLSSSTPAPSSLSNSRRNSGVGTRASSIFAGSTEDVATIRAHVVGDWLHAKQMQLMWSSGAPGEGVIMKQARGSCIACPNELQYVRGDLFDAVVKLNVRIAMTINTGTIKVLLCLEDHAFVDLGSGLRIQILPSIVYLPTCQVHHFAAFIQDSATLVVWGDDPKQILEWAGHIEKRIALSSASFAKDLYGRKSVLITEKAVGSDLSEEAEIKEKPRRVAIFHSFLTACTMALLLVAIGTGWRQIATELAYDKNMLRMAFLAVVPLQAWLGMFFFQTIVGCIAQLIGPINQTGVNSKFFSGAAPRRIEKPGESLPHVTVQCPVFKEGLHAVIMPTIKSLKAAISVYEMQGGSANIFVNDDGMQLLSEYDAQLRREFYAENHIGWVARPKHNTDTSSGDPLFIRQGRFKKASNMNYGLTVSTRVEEKLVAYHRSGGWTHADEEEAYASCLEDVLQEDEGRTWAEGNIRIGDYILLIDSDTRVPEDCFLDPVTEMEQSPEVAIIQFPSGVLNVTHSFFENGISFFTSLVYTAICYVVSCGDVCPFVGHNALVRWRALQEVAMTEIAETPEGKVPVEKFWSEMTVSEDFELALRLQTVGYIIRLAFYKGTEFKEGVSLTVYDELARWKKYAYGCSELLFHPFYYWPTRGPFTPTFRKFIKSGMPLPSKIGIMSYIGTYYAIGSAYLLITLNFFLVGWYLPALDHYYIDSFRILFSIIIIFSGAGMVALAVLRYRTGEKSFLPALFQNLKWIFMLYIFFGGISMHVSGAILCHLFGINIQWSATMKEAQDTAFFVEMGKLFRKFWATFAFCILMIAAMVYCTEFAPALWRIDEFIAIFPLATTVFTHAMLPIALNPSLMLFTW